MYSPEVVDFNSPSVCTSKFV